jgi:hypothetical protein
MWRVKAGVYFYQFTLITKVMLDFIVIVMKHEQL